MLYLGIDGGASKTKFVLSDENLKEIKKIELGSTNPNDIGFEKAQEILTQGIKEVCASYEYKDICGYAGLSGGTIGGNQAKLKEFFSKFNFRNFRNGSDLENVKELGIENGQGIVMIMGTGIVAYAVKDGIQKRIAGWGQFFDDGGSGYNYGKDAIAYALRYKDGTGKKTILLKMIEDKIGGDIEENLNLFYKNGKKYIASFCKDLFDAYKKGDEVANEIIDKNVEFVSKILKSGKEFVGKTPVNVSFAGSLTKDKDIIFKKLEKYLDIREYNLKIIEDEPYIGAIKIAIKESKNA